MRIRPGMVVGGLALDDHLHYEQPTGGRKPARQDSDFRLEAPAAQQRDARIIDEFGFDRLERTEAPQATSLLYKVVDARGEQRSTALVTNIDFRAWGEYLGDPPLAMALLDRVVDGAIILKISGKSYRARGDQPSRPAVE